MDEDKPYRTLIKCCPKGTGRIVLKEKHNFGSFISLGPFSKYQAHIQNHLYTNNNTNEEYKHLFRSLANTDSFSLLRNAISWGFALCDIENRDFPTGSEMSNVLSAIYKMVGSVMKMPEDESTPEKRTDKIFRQMDKNKDGKLSLEEFIEGAKSDPSIVRLLQCDPQSSQ
ncbi:unnamed protein product, partial [Meganyctiphanes norvegica]